MNCYFTEPKPQCRIGAQRLEKALQALRDITSHDLTCITGAGRAVAENMQATARDTLKQIGAA